MSEKMKKRVLFVGIPDMAYVCFDGLKMAGVNIVGVVGPRREHDTFKNFKVFLAMRGVDLIEYDSLDDGAFLQKLRNLNADIAVVCSFNDKIPQIMLKTTKDGFLNVHPSLLPKYRGGNPYSNVIAKGENQTGVTIHFMDEGFDTGDIVAQQAISVGGKETMGTLFNRLNFLGLEMLVEVLKSYEAGELNHVKQPQGDFVTGNNISDDKLFIDWNKSAKEIEAFVRALNPFLIASTSFRQTFVKIFSADWEKGKSKLPVGSITKISKDKFSIVTANGFLVPKVIQFGSFFIGTSEDFVRFLNPKEGEVFK